MRERDQGGLRANTVQETETSADRLEAKAEKMAHAIIPASLTAGLVHRQHMEDLRNGAAALRLLKRLEWCGSDDLEYVCCPECGVRKTGQRDDYSDGKHRTDCELDRLIRGDA